MALLIVAATAAALLVALLEKLRPKDPIFEVRGIEFKGFKLRFRNDSPVAMLLAVIDVELVLSIKVTNPNVAPIEYTSTVMDIYYLDTLLGKAMVQAGSQGAGSSEVIQVPAKLDGLQVTSHVKDLAKDVIRREMELHSAVTIKGFARVWRLKHQFEVHVDSGIKVDPVFLRVIEQENQVQMQLASLV